jgi:hypothetical protein
MMTKAMGVGVKSLINYSDKKKPAYIWVSGFLNFKII